MRKKLKVLLSEIECKKVFGGLDVSVVGVFDDSRKVENGGLFVAVSGLTNDGHEYIESAISNGVSVAVGEKKPKKEWLKKITYVQVNDSREALAILASNWYGNPSKKMKMIGVTGTDGKTTTVSMIHHILSSAGKRVGMINTVSAKIAGKEYDTGFHVTNPEALELHRYFKLMIDEGCEYCVLEVTSHGIDQKRVFGIDFDLSVLTNITHEHLDYHKTMGNYIKTKSWLANNSKTSFVNKKSYKDMKKYLGADKDIKMYEVDSLKGRIGKTVKDVFSEEYNRMNATAAVLVARELGISDSEIITYLKTYKFPIGRLEKIKNKKEINIYIDFAHTPNSLENILKTLGKKAKGGLICVFGCAGERDGAKRPMMGKIATQNADITVFTAEDPRHESVLKIIKEMEKGAKKAGGERDKTYFVEPDRGKAIWFAVNKIARKGDTVVVCGKGHEKSMNYGGVEYPWSDREALKEALLGRRKSISYLKGKMAAVLGYGVEGKDLVKFLLAKGALVTIFDLKEREYLDLSEVDTKRVKIVTGENYLKGGFSNYDVLYRSPGVYRYKEEILKAEKSGVEISSAIKLFMELCPGRVIGVTGTKGKGTTSSLIYEILKEAGKEVYLAGNIGVAYLDLLGKLSENSWVILELSSFQLIDLTNGPHVGVVLNVTQDHLDWHKDINEYIDAKKNIVRYQGPEDFAVVNGDYKISRSFGKVAGGKVVYFSGKDSARDFDVSQFLLRGRHNWENIAAAVTTCRAIGIKEVTIKKAVYAFSGLEHRLEFVREYKRVSFYNDSFSTNPEPAIAAVNSFDEPITIILGGYDKGLDYGNLGAVISRKKNMASVILIGETASKIKRALKKSKYGGKLIELGKPTVRKIVKAAFDNTPKGGVVIFSPASASFDMFKDYKDRGKKFKKVVKKFSRNG